MRPQAFRRQDYYFDSLSSVVQWLQSCVTICGKIRQIGNVLCEVAVAE
jgi:hypothetical protein